MALTVTGAFLDGKPCALRCDDATIVELGPDVVPHPGDEVLDGRGMALIAPFVNGHTHAAMTLLRGYGSDLPLQAWLEDRIWPAEARLTDEAVYWGTRLAALEMIRSGTTRFFDMYWRPEQVAAAATDAGIRAVVGAPLIDVGSAAAFGALRDSALASLDALADAGPLVTCSLTPHAPYTVSADAMAWVGALAAERDLIIHIHVAETVTEQRQWHDAHDVALSGYLDEHGILGPCTILAHGCTFDDDEYDLIAERGATIVTNPVSNMKLANGRAFPYPRARAAGVPIGLGTDGAASNNSLDMLADVKVLALLQKHTADDPTVLPAHEALAIAQGQRSALLGGGELAVGAPADFLLVRTDAPEMQPGPLVDALVYAAGGEVVDTTVVAGRVLMHDRQVPGADDVVAAATDQARRLLAGA